MPPDTSTATSRGSGSSSPGRMEFDLNSEEPTCVAATAA
jgi:hypothetical protein